MKAYQFKNIVELIKYLGNEIGFYFVTWNINKSRRANKKLQAYLAKKLILRFFAGFYLKDFEIIWA